MESVVVITGATGGLGRVFARETARRGWDLFLTDRDNADLEGFSEALGREHGVSVRFQTADLTDRESRERLFAHLEEQRIRPWMVINVAGLDHEGAFLDRSRGEIEEIIRVNIEGTAAVSHALTSLRDRGRRFYVVIVGSMAGFYPMPLKATYAASKDYLRSFSLALREELRPIGGSSTVLMPAGMATTEEARRAIAAQGVLGALTTVEVGRVARLTLDAALRGRAIVLPGAANRIIHAISALLPQTVIARLVAARWRKARAARRPYSPITGRE